MSTTGQWHSPLQRSRTGAPSDEGEPPLASDEPIREWAFSELRGDSLVEVEVDADIVVGGLVHELHEFGPTSRDSAVFLPDGSSLPPDGIATGQITSTADGVTYWVGAEAPAGTAQLPDDPIGARARLRQTQSFAKLAPDASLSVTVTSAFIETTDLNEVLALPCPSPHLNGRLCDLVRGEVFLDVVAFTVPAAPEILPFDTFFHVAGRATVTGYSDLWRGEVSTTHQSRIPMWDEEDSTSSSIARRARTAAYSCRCRNPAHSPSTCHRSR